MEIPVNALPWLATGLFGVCVLLVWTELLTSWWHAKNTTTLHIKTVFEHLYPASRLRIVRVRGNKTTRLYAIYIANDPAVMVLYSARGGDTFLDQHTSLELNQPFIRTSHPLRPETIGKELIRWTKIKTSQLQS